MIVPLTISDRNLSVRLTRTQVVPSAISQKFGRTSALQLNLHSNRFEICVNRGADVERFVSQLARRYRAIEPILEPAEKLGSEIERRPHADHLDEIAKTGVSRVVSYGVAFFVDGKLAYYPERQTVLMKPMAEGRTFQVLEHWKGQ